MLRFDGAQRGKRAQSATLLKPHGRRASSPFDGFAQADPAGFRDALPVPPRRRGSRVSAGQRPWLWTPACKGYGGVHRRRFPHPLSYTQKFCIWSARR